MNLNYFQLTNPLPARPQRDHYILLHLPGSDNLFTHHRCRCRPSRNGSIPVLRGRPERSNLSAMHLSSRQWIRRLPTLRRWHCTLSVADSSSIRKHVRTIIHYIAGDLQVMGLNGPSKYHGLVRCALPAQRNLHCGVSGHAAASCYKHS